MNPTQEYQARYRRYVRLCAATPDPAQPCPMCTGEIVKLGVDTFWCRHCGQWWHSSARRKKRKAPA